MGDETHKFDRRTTDANLEAIGVRLQGLEGRVEVLEQKSEATNLELRANTELTRQTHRKVEDIHDVLDAARGGFKLIEGAGRIAKPLLWVILLVGSVWGYIVTGHWPDFKP